MKSLFVLLLCVLCTITYCSENQKFLEGIVFRAARFGDLPLRPRPVPINEFEYIAVNEKENSLVGYCLVSRNRDRTSDKMQTNILIMSVCPDYKGRGVEQQLELTARNGCKYNPS
jgi:hypothetical protein